MNGYLWSVDWIQPYESAWGIIEKIKYANCISNAEFLIHFAKDYKPYKHNSYWDLSWIDSERFISKMNFDVDRCNQETLKNILGILVFQKNSFDLLYRENLTYCPVCIKTGYHSIFHQLLLFKVCPIHDIELTSKCPKCGRSSLYQLDYGSETNIFKCCCGYSFVDFNDPFSYSAQWRNTVFSLNDQVCRWVEINTNANENTKVFLLREDPGHKVTIDFSNIVSVMTGGCKYKNDIEYHKMSSLNSCDYRSFREDIEDQLYFRMLGIFKSIARQNKKKNTSRAKLRVVKLHGILIGINEEYFDRFVKSDGYKTLGYLSWRSLVEYQESISFVEFHLTHCRLGSNFSHSPYRRRLSYGYVYYLFMLQWACIQNICKDNTIDAFCLFDCFIACSLQNIYDNIMENIRMYDHLLRYTFLELPSLFMVISLDNSKTFEFYYFKSK